MALLQLPNFPKPFLFDNDDDSEPTIIPDSQMEEDSVVPTPNSAPVALMGSMAPMASVEETGDLPQPTGSAADEIVPASPLSQSQPQPATNGVVEDEDEDEDAITYEPVKTPSRGSRSNKPRSSASKPRSSRKNRLASQPRDQSKERTTENPTSPEPSSEKPAVEEPEQEPATKPSKPSPSPPPPPSLQFEVVLGNIAPEAKQEYEPVFPGDEIYRILEMIPTGVPGETWLSAEFEDGHIDQVSTC